MEKLALQVIAKFCELTELHQEAEAFLLKSIGKPIPQAEKDRITNLAQVTLKFTDAVF